MTRQAAQQEAFEEATRLKNQYRALDDDEAEFLDSVLEATRKKEAEVKKETLEQLDAFRKRQEEAERKALEEETAQGPKEDEAHWVTHGRKRKKGHELLKGVKLRRASSAADDEPAAKKPEVEKPPQGSGGKETRERVKTSGNVLKMSPTEPKSTSPPSKPPIPLSLGLGYASSDDDD